MIFLKKCVYHRQRIFRVMERPPAEVIAEDIVILVMNMEYVSPQLGSARIQTGREAEDERG